MLFALVYFRAVCIHSTNIYREPITRKVPELALWGFEATLNAFLKVHEAEVCR